MERSFICLILESESIWALLHSNLSFTHASRTTMPISTHQQGHYSYYAMPLASKDTERHRVTQPTPDVRAASAAFWASATVSTLVLSQSLPSTDPPPTCVDGRAGIPGRLVRLAYGLRVASIFRRCGQKGVWHTCQPLAKCVTSSKLHSRGLTHLLLPSLVSPSRDLQVAKHLLPFRPLLSPW